MKKSLLVSFILIVTLNAAALHAQRKCPWDSIIVADGVYWKYSRGNCETYGSQMLNVLDIDLSVSGLYVKPVQCHLVNGKRQYEGVDSMAIRTSAIGGINGGFFCHGTDDICSDTDTLPKCLNVATPLAFLKIDGEVISFNCKMNRTVFGITSDNKYLIGHIGVDSDWVKVEDAIGAGPNLISFVDNFPIISITQEGFPWYNEPAPRTAVVITGNNHLLLVTIDGRQPGADGMTIGMLALFVHDELDAKWAMNFDGGGSTTMWVKNRGVVNKPSDGSVRPVYDGLFIYSK